MTDKLDIEEADFPGLYQAADADSGKAQRSYFRTLGWFLSLLIIGSVSNLFSDFSPLPNIIAAILLLGALLLSGLLAWKRFDKTWYSGRAVAESVKTRSWRFMMRTEPFNIEEDNAIKLFLSDLEEILTNNRDVTKELCDESASEDAISSKMKLIRTLPIEERLSFYVKNRVSNQGGWYKKKAKENKDNGDNWFFKVVFLNVAAIICSLFKIKYSNWTYLPTEVLTVAAASAVSWLQAKKFTELSTSYTLTSHEINLIRAKGTSVSTEEELSQYVSDTENAFSREHTQWAARRDAVCR